MAVTFRSSSTFDGSGFASLTINAPAGVSAGDVLIAVATQNGTSTSLATPSGWSLLASITINSAGKGYVYTRTATASEPANYTFTQSGTNGDWCAAIVCYTGNSPAIDVESSVLTTSSANPNNCPSITTSRPGVLVYVGIVAAIGSSGALKAVPPTGFTVRLDANVDVNGSQNCEFCVADISNPTIGATGVVQSSNSASSFPFLTTAIIQIYDVSLYQSGLFFGATI